jgi:hypothetical protein
MDWDLDPGDMIERTQLHLRYGGRTQGGIGPSKQSPNVLLFSDPVSGEQHGYFDGWGDDGCFHFVGEGQRGDQRMVSGNASVLRHGEDSRALRLFQGARGIVRYFGEFDLDDDRPWYYDDAPETNDGPIRQVIVFRLRPKDAPIPAAPDTTLSPAPSDEVSEVPVEEQHAERTFIDPNREPFEAERREAKLVQHYRRWLRDQGREVTRLKIVPEGERKPLFNDIWDKSANDVVEAKGTVTREAIRMAIGQLTDYSRFIDSKPTLSVLVPTKPRADLLRLVHSVGVDALWPEDGQGFHRDPA